VCVWQKLRLSNVVIFSTLQCLPSSMTKVKKLYFIKRSEIKMGAQGSDKRAPIILVKRNTDLDILRNCLQDITCFIYQSRLCKAYACRFSRRHNHDVSVKMHSICILTDTSWLCRRGQQIRI